MEGKSSILSILKIKFKKCSFEGKEELQASWVKSEENPFTLLLTGFLKANCCKGVEPHCPSTGFKACWCKGREPYSTHVPLCAYYDIMTIVFHVWIRSEIFKIKKANIVFKIHRSLLKEAYLFPMKWKPDKDTYLQWISASIMLAHQ